MVAENAREVAHSAVRERFRKLIGRSGGQIGSPNGGAGNAANASALSSPAELKQIFVTQLINAYRVRGHQLADTDPLGSHSDAAVREVRLNENGLSEADLETVFRTPSLEGIENAPLKDIIAHLERCYCGSIGYEFMYIDYTPQKEWLQQRIESVGSAPSLTPEAQRWILERVTAAESMERHLGSRYVGQKRFSIEGGESLIVIMSELVRRAGAAGVRDMVIGMAHRGRLNVLVNILGKNPAELFEEFEGKRQSTLSSGDVKYHQGFSSDIQTSDGHMHLSMAFNPVAPGDRLAGGGGLGALAPGSVRRQAGRAGDPDRHPRRRGVRRSGGGHGDLQHGRLARVLHQGHRAHHRQQSDRLHDQQRQGCALHAVRHRRGQDDQRARSSTSTATIRKRCCSSPSWRWTSAWRSRRTSSSTWSATAATVTTRPTSRRSRSQSCTRRSRRPRPPASSTPIVWWRRA